MINIFPHSLNYIKLSSPHVLNFPQEALTSEKGFLKTVFFAFSHETIKKIILRTIVGKGWVTQRKDLKSS